MKRYYFLLAGAVLLDGMILPWLFGVSWLPKAVIMALSFIFLRLERRNLYIVLALTLVYLRAVSDFNLGILFLALATFLFFEKWFLVSFFHKEAWQTLALSGLGVIAFYVVLGGLANVLTPDVFNLNAAWAISATLSAAGGSGVNFLFRKFSS
ncbi:MAG: hypothetical protein HYT38_00305 [Candidatus Sungbacteria bacterium]|nr:hypothetical protein [Candidatus Sungbacteria bacterium]